MKRSKLLNVYSLLIGVCLFFAGAPTSNVRSSPVQPLMAPPVVVRVPGDVGTLQQAFTSVPNGGIIELAAGTYPSPTNGWSLNDINKQFTVRAASGAIVTLSGGGSNIIIKFQNTDLNVVKHITFERIIFSNGYSNINGLAGGVTIYKGKATFVDCKFVNNRLADTVATMGGAAYVADNSTVFFFNTEWSGNNAKSGGAGLGIRSGAKVYIHNSQFLNNGNGNLYDSVGAAVNIGNSLVRITNSRFDNNRAGLYGGALYVIGSWAPSQPDTPQADVIVANSLFSNNSAVKDLTSTGTQPREGGAVNIEDQSLVRIYNSRFINNKANIAGGVNIFRASVEIYGSVFLGNQANDTRQSSGFGGAISVNSNDIPDDGTINRQNASLVLYNSWLQGRYGTTSTSAISGACLYTNGDGPRIENNDSVPNSGTVADNRTSATVFNNVFYDCDTHASDDGKSASGAIYSVLTNLDFQNNIIASSTAENGVVESLGGGMTLLYHTNANIVGTTFVDNESGLYGGGAFFQGSNVNISTSKFFENSNPEYGAALFTSVDDGRKINMTGSVQSSIFSSNPGKYIVFDDDRNVAGAPYNGIIYNSNQFYNGGKSDYVYWDNVAKGGDAGYLNAVVVQRPQINVATDKSPQGNNSDLSNAPVLASILSAPSYILSNRAAGEASNPAANVLYAWSGASAKFNGSSVIGPVGTATITSAGIQTFTVGSENHTVSISQKPSPAASFTIFSGTFPLYTLRWALTSGSFLDVAITNDVNHSHTASGSVSVSVPVDNTYYLYVVTQEGGILKSVNSSSSIDLKIKRYLPSLGR